MNTQGFVYLEIIKCQLASIETCEFSRNAMYAYLLYSYYRVCVCVCGGGGGGWRLFLVQCIHLSFIRAGIFSIYTLIDY